MRSIDVFLTPSRITVAELAGQNVDVVDILRATTTMIAALDAGATEIMPAATVDAAREMAKPRSECFLAGERHCLPIDGFDFGNSPRALRTARAIWGRPIIMTTTNGTVALLHCRQASQVLIGAFSNLTAITRALDDESFAIVCAGTDGQPTAEDALFAGAVVAMATRDDPQLRRSKLNFAAAQWHKMWQSMKDNSRLLTATLRDSAGGLNLIAAGLENDIEYAAQIDISESVPQFSPEQNLVRLPLG